MATQLYINNTLVDTTDSISIPLTKEIADIRQPESRGTSFTKTVVLMGTKTNNKLFTHIFDVSLSIQNASSGTNFLPDFNPNLKASCQIYVDNILQVRGYVQLLQVNIMRENKIEYEVAIYGELGNLFGAIGSKKLSVLDLSRYNHTWEIDTIANSWDVSVKDSTAPSGTATFALGNGYVYAEVDYGAVPNLSIMNGRYYRPSVYAKTIVDKIFSDAGYTYTSDSFFNTTTFKRLIVPYTGTGFVLSDAEITARRVEFTGGASGTTISSNVIFPTEITGTMGSYNTTTGVLTVAKVGYYALNGYFQIRFADPFNPSAPTPKGLRVAYGLYKNGVSIYTAYARISYWMTLGSIPYETYNYNTGEVFLEVGDTLEWQIDSVYDEHTGLSYSPPGFYVDTDGDWEVYATETIPYNEPVDMNTILPPDVLQSDFLTSLTKLFHLYWDNTSLPYEMKVQSREAYLTNNILDWSNKLDISRPVNILPMGALDANPYNFTYKEDSDYYNKLYQDEYSRVYGDTKYYINNDFIKNEKKIEVIFSPTVLANEPAWNIDRVLPSIKNYDSSGTLSVKAGNIRLLYYGGLKTCNPYTIDSQTLPYVSYPYAGHLDDPYNSTFDINFGVPSKIYYGAVGGGTISYTANNLFHTYYENYINDITNKDSKIVRAYFRLRPLDVAQIDFSYLYYFMGQYFRLNRMIDHEVGGEGLTQCEFIKAPLGQTEGTAVGIGVMIIGSTFIVG